MSRSILIIVLLFACAKKVPATEDIAATVAAPVADDMSGPRNASEARAALSANFARVYFDLDSASLNDTSREALLSNAEILQGFPELVIEIQGHADERGTTDYNLALGDRRAESVKTVLTSSGAAPGQLRIVSFGEEVPAAQGQGESVWSKNRRAEFRVVSGATGQVEGTVE